MDLYGQDDLTHDLEVLSQQQGTQAEQDQGEPSTATSKHSQGTNIESKLDNILKKMKQIKNKNVELEKRLLSS